MRSSQQSIESGKRSEVRRGRISHATYLQAVGQSLARDWFGLEKCDILSQLDLVQHLVALHPDRYPSPGWAVRALLDKSMDDVVALCRSHPDSMNLRIIEFMEARRSGTSIKAIAERWGLSRECVSCTVGRQVTRLVTDRVLYRNTRGTRPMGQEPVALPPRSQGHQPLTHSA